MNAFVSSHVLLSTALVTLFVANTLPMVNADYATNDNRYTNMNFDTVQMYQDDPAVSPYMLFETLARQCNFATYGDDSGVFSTAAAQKFYAERGVKQFYNTWHVDNGGQMLSSLSRTGSNNISHVNDAAENPIWSQKVYQFNRI